MMAMRGLPRAIDTSFAADTYDTLRAIPARRALSAAGVVSVQVKRNQKRRGPQIFLGGRGE
jgi:hypothetical protein